MRGPASSATYFNVRNHFRMRSPKTTSFQFVMSSTIMHLDLSLLAPASSIPGLSALAPSMSLDDWTIPHPVKYASHPFKPLPLNFSPVSSLSCLNDTAGSASLSGWYLLQDLFVLFTHGILMILLSLVVEVSADRLLLSHYRVHLIFASISTRLHPNSPE